jgi:hypothetical protein
LDDLLPDIGFTGYPQVEFVPGLNHQRGNNGKGYQDQKPAGQIDAQPAPTYETPPGSRRLARVAVPPG